ncbi:GMC family oxidoreductase [Mycobacterium dioxanotrophicus]|nr:GMC family oxidoreductase [Mycobacterium dioxanotrophicus]
MMLVTSPKTPTADVDVVIVGSGMAGGALAKRLSDGGLRVVCLEQGRPLHPAELRHFSDTWEWDKQREWNVHPNVRKLPQDYPIGGEPHSIRNRNDVGGSLNHWSAHWPRFKPVDFRKGTEHGLAPDWPISYEDLEPYYDINDREMGISGRPGDPAYPPRTTHTTPPIPLGTFGRTMARGFEKLGWHWWWMDNAIITKPLDGRLPCNHCGQCILGCPRSSISTSATGYLPRALANGAQLRTGCRVEQIIVDGDTARGVIYVDIETGQRYRQDAKAVIVAGNGIGTPRLLLVSANSSHRDGLANSSGQLGRNLMYHPQAFVEGIFEESLDGYKGARGAPLFSQQFYETDPSRGFVNGFTALVVRAPGAGVAANGYWTREPVPWGPDHHKEFARLFGHHAWIIVMAEELPSPTNRVTLDPELTDSTGMPAPKVEYRVHPNDRKLVEFGIARSREVMTAAGAYDVTDSGLLDPPPGYHLLGTARMGTDPADSVTNRWHQAWDIPNLFICDGSSMPTSAGVNPTPTIGAMAVRLADFLVREGNSLLGGDRPRLADDRMESVR